MAKYTVEKIRNIALCGHKSTGKTTLVAQLAVALAARGRRVALVDIDPQGSLTRWFEVRGQRNGGAGNLSLSSLTGWRTQSAVEKLAAVQRETFNMTLGGAMEPLPQEALGDGAPVPYDIPYRSNR